MCSLCCGEMWTQSGPRDSAWWCKLTYCCICGRVIAVKVPSIEVTPTSKKREILMSVSFTPEKSGPVLGYSVSLWCADKVSDFGPDKALVENFLSKHNSICQECQEYNGGFSTEIFEWAPVSLSNGNAVDILTVLGFEVYPDKGIFGAEEAGYFLKRTISALEGDLDRAAKATVVGGRVLSFGSDKEYLKRRIGALAGIATWARLNNTKVVWG